MPVSVAVQLIELQVDLHQAGQRAVGQDVMTKEVHVHVVTMKDLRVRVGMTKDLRVRAEMMIVQSVTAMTAQVDQVQADQDVMTIVPQDHAVMTIVPQDHAVMTNDRSVVNGQVNVQKQVMIANVQDVRVVYDQVQVGQVNVGMIAHVVADLIVRVVGLQGVIVIAMNVRLVMFPKSALTSMIR
jgi:hypothetical protein